MSVRRLAQVALIALAALTMASATLWGASGTPHAWVVPSASKGTFVSHTGGSYAVTMNWSNLEFPGTTGYNVFENPPGGQVGTTTAMRYAFTGLSCGTTYTLGVQAHNGSSGTGQTVSTTYTTPACSGGAPSNTALPVVSDSTNSGLYESGDVVSATTGTWTNTPTSYSYQWMDEDTPISGATSSTYTLASSDLDHTVDVVVTATNGGGTSAPAPSASSGVVVNPCGTTATTWANAVSDVNAAASGSTICLGAGTYTATTGTISVNDASGTTTLEATPGATQPTLTGAPNIGANNFRLEGFHLTNGTVDTGASGTVKLVNNYYHDCATGSCGALWNGAGANAGTIYELHNRMVNVTVTSSGETQSDANGIANCDQNCVQNYNSFSLMNNHPFICGTCGTAQIIGNDYVNTYFQYSPIHSDCFEWWSNSGAGTFEDNRCIPSNPEGVCATNGGGGSGPCGNDALLSGDNTAPLTVKNNLIVDPAGNCLDMHYNASSNNGANNDDIENNTLTGCGAGALPMISTTGGHSGGNTVKFNILDDLAADSCSSFVASGEDFNNISGTSPGCGTHDTSLTPAFTSTVPTDPGATYATTNINSAWGYQVGCTSITVCKGRVGYDAHIPTP